MNLPKMTQEQRAEFREISKKAYYALEKLYLKKFAGDDHMLDFYEGIPANYRRIYLESHVGVLTPGKLSLIHI